MPPRRTRATQSSSSPAKYKQQTLLSHFPSSPPAPTRGKATNDLTPKSRKGGRGTQTKTPLHDSGSDAEIIESPLPKRVSRQQRRRSMNNAGDSDSSDVAKIHFEPQSSSGTSNATGRSSSEDSETLSPNRPAKRPRVLGSESEENEAKGDRPRNSRLRRLAKRAREEGTPSHSEEDRKPKGRLVKGRRRSTSDEEEDILSGIDEDKIVDNRLRRKQTQKSRFMQNLERLKKKKRGHAVSESNSEGEASDDGGLIPGARRDREGGSETSELEDDETGDSEEKMDDFIVEDEGNAPTAVLPAIFSMNTHQDLVHQFKVVCQYLVHLAVTTSVARARIAKRLTSDEYFSMALSITRRKLSDIRDSIVSSVWRTDYKRALMRYPEFTLNDLSFAIPSCDACHLGGRLSTVVGRLSGDPYDRTTFETKKVNNDSEGSNDESSDVEHLPREFNLGRFCARRTSTYHELCHWEYAVFTALSREVESLSNNGLGFIRVGYAEGVEPPEDISDADQVMEWLDRRDVINFEWLRIKDLISRATNLDADVKRGEKD